MTSTKMLVWFWAFALAMTIYMETTHCFATKGNGACPMKETVKACLPKCLSDFDCPGARRCCKNTCGSQSCARVVPVNSGNEPTDNSRTPIVTCANEKCLPGQKCLSNNSMKRPKCSW